MNVEKLVKERSWDLFRMEGSQEVSDMLDNLFIDSVNEGKSKDETREVMLSAMKENWKYGASDTEPRENLHMLLYWVYDEGQ
jgi:hypothetical protein